jgi:hypothetical protein
MVNVTATPSYTAAISSAVIVNLIPAAMGCLSVFRHGRRKHHYTLFASRLPSDQTLK